MRIYVTQKDIREGIKSGIYACPVARAIQRKFPYSTVFVGPNYIFIEEKKYKVPSKVGTFIKNFDSSLQVLRINFRLDLTNEIQY